MKIKELKLEFHALIDQINDPLLIEQFYNAMSRAQQSEGGLWASLTSEQQQGILEAYDESNDDQNLIPLDQIKAKYANWS
ncbi:hypothetical protein DYU05_08465 [Mucilaginibacter terrenus]|uniref:Uncharacterized protein n=1 Tax=Mucilaginibacter terrenus TaxID=2482727 RepID=A0A3E2NX90_9SPHI|nr:hypothetical protein [Mucilaginibacter terrenus]RFZ85613.1 hypothetical protein DYU05_08465 [Mucilaginibacter terrenus]